jgi:hypothetical protein
MKPETKTIISKIVDTVLKRKEQTRIFRELHETITTALEVMKYEVLEEDVLKQTLIEIAETTTKTPCNIVKHPDTEVKDILNTPTLKIQQLLKTQTLICSKIGLHDIKQISITFEVETVEIQTPNKNYIIVTNVKEVRPTW